MITKYAVLNHLTGKYTQVDSEEEAKKLCIKFVIDLYNTYVHGHPYIRVEIDEQGNETWQTANNGTDIPEKYLLEMYKAI